MAQRQPIFNIPGPVFATLLLLAAIHAASSLLSNRMDAAMLAHLAFVPGRLTAAFDPVPVMQRLMALAAADPGGEATAGAARFFLGSGSPQPWTMLTYALLHAGWVHFGFNAVWLLAFGTPVARRCGSTRFLLLFVASAFAGAVAHFAVDPLSLQPLIGASAAVSGCMGAALRFMFKASVRLGAADDRAYRAPRLSLWDTLRDHRAAAFLVVWMITNVVTGAGAVGLGLSDMPVAWQAHIGGLLVGLLAFPLFDPVDTADPGLDATQAPDGPAGAEP